MTTARWTRNFVQNHPDYKQDSVVSERINYDLVEACSRITQGEMECPELLIKYDTKTSDDIPVAMQKAEKYLDGLAKRNSNPRLSNGIVD